MKLMRLFRETVVLRDGRKVVLRPIQPTDAGLLVRLHERLSRETQYMRFFGAKPHLTHKEAEYLASVDFDRRFAIVASVSEDDHEALAAVGRFDLVDPGGAEAAIVVRDDYQRAGLGTSILERMLEVARGRGVRTFSGEILAENRSMLQLLRSGGLELGRPEDSVVKVAVPIDESLLPLNALKIVATHTARVVDRTPGLRRLRGRQST